MQAGFYFQTVEKNSESLDTIRHTSRPVCVTMQKMSGQLPPGRSGMLKFMRKQR